MDSRTADDCVGMHSVVCKHTTHLFSRVGCAGPGKSLFDALPFAAMGHIYDVGATPVYPYYGAICVGAAGLTRVGYCGHARIGVAGGDGSASVCGALGAISECKQGE